MAMVASSGGMRTGPAPSGLADVVQLILDKGLVIDAFVRVSVIGIELLTIDARIVIASVDTYLRFAEAVNRLDLTEARSGATIQDLQRGGAKEKVSGALEGAKETIGEKLPGKSKEEKAKK
jgi:gas vesicle structural protein